MLGGGNSILDFASLSLDGARRGNSDEGQTANNTSINSQTNDSND